MSARPPPPLAHAPEPPPSPQRHTPWVRHVAVAVVAMLIVMLMLYEHVRVRGELVELRASTSSSRRIHNNPAVLCDARFLSFFEDVDNAVRVRREWSQHLSWKLEAKLNDVYSRLGSPIETPYTHERFDMLGPIGPRCAKLSSFGSGDGEKRVCGNALVDSGPDCVVVSFGNFGSYDFEQAVFGATQCVIHVFDCFHGGAVPAHLTSRVFIHPICIGGKDQGGNGKPRFMTWHSLIRYLNLTQEPSHVKMDIEGWEYEVMRDIIDSQFWLPRQVSMEVHYQTYEVPYWNGNRLKHESELAIFMDYLWREGGYALVDRHDNVNCKHCSEIVVAKVLC